MKNLILTAVASAFLLASCGKGVSNPNPKVDKDEATVPTAPTVVTDTAQVSKLLHRLQVELYGLSMVSHDVVTNVDAIINTEENISALIKQLDSCQDIITPEQQARYDELRGQWKQYNGE